MYDYACEQRRHQHLGLSMLLGGRTRPLLIGYPPVPALLPPGFGPVVPAWGPAAWPRPAFYGSYAVPPVAPFSMGPALAWSPYAGALLVNRPAVAYGNGYGYGYGYGCDYQPAPWYSRLAASLLSGW